MIKEEKEQFLRRHGWSQWYHLDYWVNTKTIEDPTIQDYTNYGLSLDEAYNFQITNHPPFEPLFAQVRRRADAISR